MPRFTQDELRDLSARMFIAAGTPERIATRVAQSLVLNNLVGLDSHGVMRIPQYMEAIREQRIIPTEEPVVLRRKGPVLLMDGRHAFGSVVAEQAMLLAIDAAREYVVGIVCFSRVLHIGRLGEWAEIAAKHGMFGLVLANGAKPGGTVAPFRARTPVLGTNPIAYALPAEPRPPVVADFSTSAASEGKVRHALLIGVQVPDGWLLDRDGEPTNDPGALYQGGAIQTSAAHKGFALSLMVEVLAGILSGGNTPVFPGWEGMQNGVFMMALDLSFFRTSDDYQWAVNLLLDKIKQAVPLHGVESVLLPGEPEEVERRAREKDGILVDPATWDAVRREAARLGVELDR